MKSQDLHRIKLECGIPLMVWLLVAGPFQTVASKVIPYSQMKEAFTRAHETLSKVLTNDSFGQALHLVKSMNHENEVTEGAIAALDESWSRTDPNIKMASSILYITSILLVRLLSLSV